MYKGGVVLAGEISFELNRYSRPKILNTKESMAQIILNALFMVPGNEPGNPEAGVNIMKYLYRTTDAIDTDEIRESLSRTIGENLVTSSISGISVTTNRMPDNTDVMAIVIQITVDDEEDSLAIILKKKDMRVHFNYTFLSQVLNIVSGKEG